MVVVRDVVLSAVQAERQQRWRDVFAKWCSLASVEPAHLRAAMLKPAVPGSEETLYDLLRRHFTEVPHPGVRRAALYLLASGFHGNLALQRSVVTETARRRSPCAFRWRSWWVLAVPRTTRRRWDARRYRLAQDQRYDLLVGADIDQPQRINAIPREALSVVDGSDPLDLTSSPDAPADWFRSPTLGNVGEDENEEPESDEMALLDAQTRVMLPATNENAQVVALAHPSPPLPIFETRDSRVAEALRRARACWTKLKISPLSARNRLSALQGGASELTMEQVRAFFRAELGLGRKKLSDAAVAVVFAAAGKDDGQGGVTSDGLIKLLDGTSEVQHLMRHGASQASLFEPAEMQVETYDERYHTDLHEILSLKLRAWEEAQKGTCKHELNSGARYLTWPPCFENAEFKRPSSNATTQAILALPDSESHVIALALDPRVACSHPCSTSAFEHEVAAVATGESTVDSSTWDQIRTRAVRLRSLSFLFGDAKRPDDGAQSSRAVSSRALMSSNGFRRWFSGVRRLFGKKVPEECVDVMSVLRNAKRPQGSKEDHAGFSAFVTWEDIVRLDHAAETVAAAAAAEAAAAAAAAAVASAGGGSASASELGGAAVETSGSAAVKADVAVSISRKVINEGDHRGKAAVLPNSTEADDSLVTKQQREQERLCSLYTNWRDGHFMASDDDIVLFSGAVDMRTVGNSMVSSAKPIRPTDRQLSVTCTSALLVHLAGLGVETALDCYSKLAQHGEDGLFSDAELQAQSCVLQYAERAAALGEQAVSLEYKGVDGDTFLTEPPQQDMPAPPQQVGAAFPAPISIPTEGGAQSTAAADSGAPRRWSIPCWEDESETVVDEVLVPVQLSISVTPGKSRMMRIRAHPLKEKPTSGNSGELSTPGHLITPVIASSEEHLKPTPAARHDVRPDSHYTTSRSAVKHFERFFGASSMAGSSKTKSDVSLPPLFEAEIPLVIEESGIGLIDVNVDEGDHRFTASQRVLALMLQCVPFPKQHPANSAAHAAAEGYMRGDGGDERDVACTLELVKNLISWFALPLEPGCWLQRHHANIVASSTAAFLTTADSRLVFSVRVPPLSPLLIALKCHDIIEGALIRLQESGGYLAKAISDSTLSTALDESRRGTSAVPQQRQRKLLQEGMAAIKQVLAALRTVANVGGSAAGGGGNVRRIGEWRRQMAPLVALRKRLMDCVKKLRILELEKEVNQLYGGGAPTLAKSSSAQTLMSSLNTNLGQEVNSSEFPLAFLEQTFIDILALELNLTSWPTGGIGMLSGEEENTLTSSKGATSNSTMRGFRVVLGDVFDEDRAEPSVVPTTRSSRSNSKASTHSSRADRSEWEYLSVLGVERAAIDEERRLLLLREQMESKKRRQDSRARSMAQSTKQNNASKKSFGKALRFSKLAKDVDRIHFNLHSKKAPHEV